MIFNLMLFCLHLLFNQIFSKFLQFENLFFCIKFFLEILFFFKNKYILIDTCISKNKFFFSKFYFHEFFFHEIFILNKTLANKIIFEKRIIF